VCEFVALWRLGVGNLVEEPGWYRAIEYEISIEELHFLDRLPPSNRAHGSWAWCRLWLILELVTVFLRDRAGESMRVGTKCVCSRRIKHWLIVCFILPVVWAFVAVGRFVGLVVVAIVMGLWVDAVVAGVGRAVRVVVVLIVAVRVVYIFYRVLAPSVY